MARSPRPSDVHRTTPPQAPPRAAPTPRHRRRWLTWSAAGLVAALAVIAVWFAAHAPAPDVDTEDDAVAALRLYLEQELAREGVAAAALPRRVEVAARHADRVDEALAEARLRTGADVAARAYWGSSRHDELVTTLRSFDGDLARLEPPALVYLRVYVQRLPDDVVAGLRGHPLARPALRRLEADT